MKLTTSINIDLTSEFKILADQIAALASKYGITLKGYRSPELPLFQALPGAKQQEVIALAKKYYASLVAIEAMGERLDNHTRSTWAALSGLGLVPPSDLFNHFNAGSAVEIYDLNNLQIWRNFETFKVCSYTLEEIYCIEWFHRYERSLEISQACISYVTDLLMGKTEDIVFPDIPSHILDETCSIEKLRLEMRFILICRLMDREGKLAAFAVISSAKLVARKVDPLRPNLHIVPTIQAQP